MRGFFYLILSGICLGTIGIFVKLIGPSISPYLLASIRVLAAAGLILIFLSFGTDSLKRLVAHITFMETLGTALFVLVGLMAILFGMNFLGNYLPIDPDIPLESGTLPVLNIIIGIQRNIDFIAA